MRNRIGILNSVFGRSGFNFVHASADPLVQSLDLIRAGVRLLGPDSVERSSKLTNLASLAYLQTLIDRFSFDVVIDVGANRGQFAMGLRRIGYEGPIVSFEPIPTLAVALRKHAEEDGKWTIIEGAVGSREEKIGFHESASSDFSSFLKPSCKGMAEYSTVITEDASHVVQIRPLREWLMRN